MYGPYFPLHNDKYLKIRILPKLLSDRSEMFRFYSCKFRIERNKENTARVTIGKQFNIANCFTLECSSFGYFKKETRATVQFKETDLIEFARCLCECILEYSLVMERDDKTRSALIEKINIKRKKPKQS